MALRRLGGVERLAKDNVTRVQDSEVIAKTPLSEIAEVYDSGTSLASSVAGPLIGVEN